MKTCIKNLIFLTFFCGMIGYQEGSAWTYPVKEVTGNFCGTSEICTIPLPKISQADYLTYQHKGLYRRIYTVLWGGTYFGGRDFGLGAHKGVDIASALGTPVYAMGSGEVVIAETRGDRGKVVTIKHQIGSRFLWSNYAHLDEIVVEVGDSVQEGQLIAKMGSSGNSTGPHVHFQIDTNEGKHPYHPGSCGGETLMQTVNEARCRRQITKNTLDPILFLETQGKVWEAEQESTTTPKSQASYFLESWDLDFVSQQRVLRQENLGALLIRSKRADTQGFLKESLKFTSNDDVIEFLPSEMLYLGSERRLVRKAKKAGLHTIKVWQGKGLIKEFQVLVLDEKMFALLEEKAKELPALQSILNEL